MPTVTVTAPVRICDCGGWTDTWFARRGAVLHIAIWPGVTVRASATPGRRDDERPAGELRRDVRLRDVSAAGAPSDHRGRRCRVSAPRLDVDAGRVVRHAARGVHGHLRRRRGGGDRRVEGARRSACDGRRSGARGSSPRDRAPRPAIRRAGSDCRRPRRRELHRDRRLPERTGHGAADLGGPQASARRTACSWSTWGVRICRHACTRR